MQAEEEEEGGPAQLREIQRAVAEREAARLARPVSSTPFGQLKRTADGAQEYWGPFRVARELILKRERLKREKEEEEKEEDSENTSTDTVQQLEEEEDSSEHPSKKWRSSLSTTCDGEGQYSKRQRRWDQWVAHRRMPVPSLFQLCVNFLVDNIDHLESLGDVDGDVRAAIAHALVASSKLNASTLPKLLGTSLDHLELVDASQLESVHLSQALQNQHLLSTVIIDQAGRSFEQKAVQALSQAKSLKHISVGGAYLLTDSDMAQLVDASTSLKTLECKACPLLSTEFCSAVADSKSLQSLAIEDLPFEETHLKSLGRLSSLTSLRLTRLAGLNDETLVPFLQDELRSLDVSHSQMLTDISLSNIRRFCGPSLKHLMLAGLRSCTATGFEVFFMDSEEMGKAPDLQELDLGRCEHDAITDEVVKGAVTASNGLVKLNLQGSVVLTDSALECIASNAKHSLQKLDVSFCGSITDSGMGHLVDSVGRQFEKLVIWGCAQLTDDFLDGHKRVNDSHFEVVGAWMKKTDMSLPV